MSWDPRGHDRPSQVIVKIDLEKKVHKNMILVLDYLRIEKLFVTNT